MKRIFLFLICAAPQVLFCQTPPKNVPVSEARKAIMSIENEQKIKDSFMKCYNGRWTLDFTYGQRFISSSNRSNVLDTITLADFTQNRSFFGIGSQYFLSNKVLVGVGIEFLILSKEQNVTSFTGTGGSGEGSGGLIFSFNLSGKYFFTSEGNTRPYLSLDIGRDQLTAKGGNVDFSLFSGRVEDINTLKRDVLSGTISTGISHRLSLGSLVDFQIGYAHTTQSEPIGGITSPGGLKASLSIHFILNAKKGN